MKIKNFEQFNEGVGKWVRNKVYKDESTAEGILSKASSLRKDDIIHNPDDLLGMISDQYLFTIDDFDISITKNNVLSHYEYNIKVDNAILKCSDLVAKKLFKLISSIYRREIVQAAKEQEIENDFSRKDAKIHFGKE